MTRWYAVHTQPHGEEKAVFHLRRQGFISYAPKYRRKRRHARREEIVTRPLFPRYIFVAIDVQSEPWRAINSTVGVAGLVCAGTTPLAIPDFVIQKIQDSQGDDGFVKLSPPPMQIGDNVRVAAGALTDCVGIFQCVDDQARVTLLLSLMGRQIKVRLPSEDIVRVA